MAVTIFSVYDAKEHLVGFIKDVIPQSVTEDETQEQADYKARLVEIAALQFETEVSEVEIVTGEVFSREDYHIFDLPRPGHRKPAEDGSARESEDTEADVAALRKKHKVRSHPNVDKAAKLKEKIAEMNRTKVITKVAPVIVMAKEGGGKKVSAKKSKDDRSPPRRRAPSRNRSASSRSSKPKGDGYPSSSDGDDDSDRDRRKRKSRKSRKRKRSPSSDDDEDSSSSDDQRYKCKADACNKKFKHKAERREHLRVCTLFFGDAVPTPWGKAGGDLDDHHVEYHQRKFTEFTDDNLSKFQSQIVS